jgi:hypothetical protein
MKGACAATQSAEISIYGADFGMASMQVRLTGTEETLCRSTE